MNSKKIVIIGAGASGIAAGTKLLELGFRNIVILEAEGRIGGRINTVPFASNVIDLGAQWCHGEKNNVVYELADKRNLLEPSSEKFYNFVCIKSNKAVIPSDVTIRLENIALEIFHKEESLSTCKCSLGTYFNEKFFEKLKKPENSDIEANTAEQFYQFYQKFQNSIDSSDSLYDVSTEGYLSYWECEGDALLNWKDKGYVTVLRILMNCENPNDEFGVLNKRIIFNKRIDEIEWNRGPNQNVSLKCSDGELIEADHVICTVSLGVLKERHSKLFKPILPDIKIRAIEGLAFGTVNKIFLEFSPKFWPEDWPGFCLLWENADLDKIRNSKNTWLEDVFAFFRVEHQPNILCAWTYGENARKMETIPEDEVQEGLLCLLRMFLEWQIPEPTALKRSCWYTDPSFRGSYSFRSIKTEEMDTCAAHLASPLENTDNGSPVLLFAGEATHDHYYSTVHGAVESGWREAHRLATLYTNLPYAQNINEVRDFDVLILGGGLAGLGAGFALKNSNKKFAILEAQDYIGGRVKTTNMLSYKLGNSSPDLFSDIIDSGAQWLHGEQNELYHVATNHDLLVEELSEEGLGSYIREDGYVFDDFFRKKVDFLIGCILEKCETYVRKGDEYPQSIEHFLEEEFQKHLNSLNCPLEQEHSKQLLDWHRRFQIIDNSCLSLKDVSAKFWGRYSYNGESCQAHINFRNGFSSLVNAVIEEIGSKRILTKKEVCDINWDVINNENRLINIHTADGETYRAKHIIVTFSLGVLKYRGQELFRPKLPRQLRSCIEDIGFEPINKIFLQFDNPWWGDVDGIQLVFKDNIYKGKPWTRYLTGFDVLKPGASNTLLGWVGSYGSIEMEKLSDEEIVSDCIELLKKFTSLEIPQPIKFYCTRWGTNKFVRGGYSYISIKCDKSSLTGKTLSAPVTIEDLTTDKSIIDNFKNLCVNDRTHNKKETELHPILLFAGEACHDQYFSTAHGAFRSGIEQAQVILKWLE